MSAARKSGSEWAAARRAADFVASRERRERRLQTLARSIGASLLTVVPPRDEGDHVVAALASRLNRLRARLARNDHGEGRVVDVLDVPCDERLDEYRGRATVVQVPRRGRIAAVREGQGLHPATARVHAPSRRRANPGRRGRIDPEVQLVIRTRRRRGRGWRWRGPSRRFARPAYERRRHECGREHRARDRLCARALGAQTSAPTIADWIRGALRGGAHRAVIGSSLAWKFPDTDGPCPRPSGGAPTGHGRPTLVAPSRCRRARSRRRRALSGARGRARRRCRR